MMNPKSITSRLTLFFSTASTLILLVVGLLVGSLVESHFEEQDLMELHGKLELVRHALAKVKTSSELTNVPQILSDALIGHPDLSVAILGPDQRILFTTPNAAFATFLLEKPRSKDLSGESESSPVMWEQEGKIYRGISAFAETGITGQSSTKVALAINIEHHQTFMKAFHNNLWKAITAGILLTIVLGWVAAR